MKLNEPGRQKEKQQKQHHQKESEIEENVYVAKQNNKAGKFCPTPLSSAPQGGRGRERERVILCCCPLLFFTPFSLSLFFLFPLFFFPFPGRESSPPVIAFTGIEVDW